MNSTPKENRKILKLHKDVIDFALINTIKQASEKFSLRYETVRILVKKYNEFGISGILRYKKNNSKIFENNRRKNSISDRRVKVSLEDTNKILTLNIDKGFGATRVKKELELTNLSISSIDRILNKAGLVKEKPQKLMKDTTISKNAFSYTYFNKLFSLFISPFQTIVIESKKIVNCFDNNNINKKFKNEDKELPSYLLTAVDLKSGLVSSAYTYENSPISTRIFIDYIKGILKENRVQMDSVNFVYGKRQNIIRDIKRIYEFDQIIGEKIEFDTITDELINSKLNTILGTKIKEIKSKVLEEEVFISQKHLLFKTYLYQIFSNNYEKNGSNDFEDLTVKEVIKLNNSKVKNEMFFIAPIICENYLNDYISNKLDIGYIGLHKADKERVQDEISGFIEKNSIVDSKFEVEEILKKYELRLLLLGNKDNDKSKKNHLLQKTILDEKVNFLRYIGKWEKADLLYIDLLKRVERDKNKFSKVKILLEFAYLNFQRNSYDIAIFNYKKGLSIAKIHNYTEFILQANYQLASLYLRINEYKKSKQYVNRTLLLAKKVKDMDALCRIYDMMGKKYYHEQRYDMAALEYQKMYDLLKRQDEENTLFLGVAIGNLAIMYKDSKNYSEALKYVKEGIKLANKSNNKLQKLLALGNEGNIYIELKHFEKAKKSFEEQAQIAIKMGNNIAAIQGYTGLGVVSNNIKEYDKALEYYKIALELALDIKESKKLIRIAYSNLGNTYKNLSLYSDASKNFNLSLEYVDEIYDIGDKEKILIALEEVKKLGMLEA